VGGGGVQAAWLGSVILAEATKPPPMGVADLLDILRDARNAQRVTTIVRESKARRVGVGGHGQSDGRSCWGGSRRRVAGAQAAGVRAAGARGAAGARVITRTPHRPSGARAAGVRARGAPPSSATGDHRATHLNQAGVVVARASRRGGLELRHARLELFNALERGALTSAHAPHVRVELFNLFASQLVSFNERVAVGRLKRDAPLHDAERAQLDLLLLEAIEEPRWTSRRRRRLSRACNCHLRVDTSLSIATSVPQPSAPVSAIFTRWRVWGRWVADLARKIQLAL